MNTAQHANTLPDALTAPAKLPHWRTTLCRIGDATDTDRKWLKSFPSLRAAWDGADRAYRLAWILGCLDLDVPGVTAAEIRARLPFAVVERALKRAQRKMRDKRGLQ